MQADVPSERRHDRNLVDLEWPMVCELIARRTRSDLGREEALSLAPAPDQHTAQMRLSVMRELMTLAEEGTTMPTRLIQDTRDVTARLSRGGVASEEELARLRRLLHVAIDLRRFGADHQERCPLVARLTTTSDELDPLLRELSAKLDEEGHVHDDASPELAKARAEVRALRSELQQRVTELIKRYREALQDGYFAERDGRYVLPVRADAPFRVDGIVLGTSASGSTLYVEPAELGKLGNRLGWAEGEVERQIAIILANLSDILRPSADELEWAREVCVRADLLAACVQFSMDISAKVLRFAPSGCLSLKSARHPLLCAGGGDVVPSDLRVESGKGLVLSGPNAGGKTVALKTMGLCALMQATGLPIPADPDSEVGFFDEILCDIGDDQSLSMSLSTFSGHVERVRSILEDSASGTLVLFDELMGGTDPDEGAVLAIATIDELTKAGAAVCVTTHYEPLKSYAEKAPHLENGAVGFDFEKMAPTFVVDIGRPGASSALIVAQRHGLPAHVTAAAEKFLPQLVAEKRQENLQREAAAAGLLEETRKLEALRDEQDKLNRRLAGEVERLQEQRRRNLEREGDELQAEIRQARAELRGLRKEFGKFEGSKLREMEAQVDRAAALTRAGGKIERATKAATPSAVDPKSLHLSPGDRVRVAGFAIEAEVLEPPAKGQVRVLLGVMKMSVPLAKVLSKTKADSSQKKSEKPPRPRREEPKSEGSLALVRSDDVTLDLRGKRVEESLSMVDHFVDELLRGAEPGGFVLHGHGTGALKEAVRTHLRAHQAVKYSRPAEREEGGDAFTILWLAS